MERTVHIWLISACLWKTIVSFVFQPINQLCSSQEMMSVYTVIKLGKIYKYGRSRICIISLVFIEVLVTYLFLNVFFYEENPWCHRHDDHHESVSIWKQGPGVPRGGRISAEDRGITATQPLFTRLPSRKLMEGLKKLFINSLRGGLLVHMHPKSWHCQKGRGTLPLARIFLEDLSTMHWGPSKVIIHHQKW